jgi:hypothetical protein
MNTARARSLALVVAITLVGATTCSAQQATKEEFVEYSRMLEGRWIAEVTWVADWPGLGKKGEKVTAYTENTIAVEGNALIGIFYGGAGTGRILTTYDAGAKQIQGLVVTSGGTVWHFVVNKENGKWVMSSTGSNADGSKLEGKSTLTISDDGNTNTWTGSTIIGGKKVDEQRDVYRRAGK